MYIFMRIMLWYWRRKILKDVRYVPSQIHAMIDVFVDRVVVRIKRKEEDNEHREAVLSTFALMLDEVRAVVKKHNDALSAISGNRELSLEEDLKESWGRG